MSYWISLVKDNEIVTVEPHQHGGTYVLGGTDTAEINVTCNYSKHFYTKDLHGKTGAETIPMLQGAVNRLGVARDVDYWNPTPGNVGYNCSILLEWAKQHPEAVWDVS